MVSEARAVESIVTRKLVELKTLESLKQDDDESSLMSGMDYNNRLSLH